jgi:hypothetical protein
VEFFRTVGNALASLALHQTFHVGQVAAVRKALGKQPVFA